MSVFEERKQLLIDEFSGLFDLQDKYTYIIEMGQAEKRLEKHFCQDCYRVKGCMSQLWLVPSYNNGLCHFDVDADAEIPRGIAVILVTLVNDLTPEEILEGEYQFLKEIGIGSILSPNRRNALAHILGSIQAFATSCLEEESPRYEDQRLAAAY